VAIVVSAISKTAINSRTYDMFSGEFSDFFRSIFLFSESPSQRLEGQEFSLIRLSHNRTSTRQKVIDI
jgi:hypothetical protein